MVDNSHDSRSSSSPYSSSARNIDSLPPISNVRIRPQTDRLGYGREQSISSPVSGIYQGPLENISSHQAIRRRPTSPRDSTPVMIDGQVVDRNKYRLEGNFYKRPASVRIVTGSSNPQSLGVVRLSPLPSEINRSQHGNQVKQTNIIKRLNKDSEVSSLTEEKEDKNKVSTKRIKDESNILRSMLSPRKSLEAVDNYGSEERVVSPMSQVAHIEPIDTPRNDNNIIMHSPTRPSIAPHHSVNMPGLQSSRGYYRPPNISSMVPRDQTLQQPRNTAAELGVGRSENYHPQANTYYSPRSMGFTRVDSPMYNYQPSARRSSGPNHYYDSFYAPSPLTLNNDYPSAITSDRSRARYSYENSEDRSMLNAEQGVISDRRYIVSTRPGTITGRANMIDRRPNIRSERYHSQDETAPIFIPLSYGLPPPPSKCYGSPAARRNAQINRVRQSAQINTGQVERGPIFIPLAPPPPMFYSNGGRFSAPLFNGDYRERSYRGRNYRERYESSYDGSRARKVQEQSPEKNDKNNSTPESPQVEPENDETKSKQSEKGKFEDIEGNQAESKVKATEVSQASQWTGGTLNIEAPKSANMPDYANMSAVDKGRFRGHFEAMFGHMRTVHRQYNIPVFDRNTSLETIHGSYESYYFHFSIKATVQFYMLFIIAFWLVMELIFTKLLGLNFSGFTLNQLKLIPTYEYYMFEFVEKYGGIGTSMSPEWKIIGMTVFSAVIYLALRTFSKMIGSVLAGVIQNVINSILKGELTPASAANVNQHVNPQRSTEGNSDAGNSSQLPPNIPDANGVSYAGLNLTSLLGTAASAISGMTGGNNNQSSGGSRGRHRSQRTRNRPRYAT